MNSTNSLPPTGEGVVIDIGTGDGLFVYQSARENPRKFYIGVDANARPLEKISEKIHRKPAKGGLPNILFVHAAVEDLPSELDGVADEVHVHFPWGSLLRAVFTADRSVLGNLRRICAPDAVLEVVLGLNKDRDRTESERLGLPPLSVEFIDSVLKSAYRDAGFEVIDRRFLRAHECAEMKCSWARRLSHDRNRNVCCILARAI